MALQDWRVHLIGATVVMGLPLPTIAQTQTTALSTEAIAVDLDYIPDRTIAVDQATYPIGQ
ncbi:MAG: hypothetical protein AAF202_12790, partial [Pseudomonadota bacterium]